MITECRFLNWNQNKYIELYFQLVKRLKIIFVKLRINCCWEHCDVVIGLVALTNLVRMHIWQDILECTNWLMSEVTEIRNLFWNNVSHMAIYFKWYAIHVAKVCQLEHNLTFWCPNQSQKIRTFAHLHQCNISLHHKIRPKCQLLYQIHFKWQICRAEGLPQKWTEMYTKNVLFYTFFRTKFLSIWICRFRLVPMCSRIDNVGTWLKMGDLLFKSPTALFSVVFWRIIYGFGFASKISWLLLEYEKDIMHFISQTCVLLAGSTFLKCSS